MNILIPQRDDPGYKFYCPQSPKRFVLYLDEKECKDSRLVLKCIGCPLDPRIGCVLPRWNELKSTTI